MFFERLDQESHSKFSFTIQNDEDLWEVPSNGGTKSLQGIRPNVCKADMMRIKARVKFNFRITYTA